MTIYEYKCENCGKVFEIKWTDRNTIPFKQPCPVCGKPSPRMFSSFQFGFSPYLRELGEGNMVNY